MFPVWVSSSAVGSPWAARRDSTREFLGVVGGGVSRGCGASTPRTHGGGCMIVNKEVMSDSMFRVNLTEGKLARVLSAGRCGASRIGAEALASFICRWGKAGAGRRSIVSEHGGQGDQGLQGAGVGRRMGAGLAGQLLSEIDRVLMCSSF